ncbi:MAG TPA: hypothetical protein VHC49_13585, partial [Mycobacteriales bacterium]|nr:hypothetical protein [Mycobacteriales bacterium]
DVAYLGDPGSDRRHQVSGYGAARAVSGTVEAGQLVEPYRAWRLDSGGRVQVRLQVGGPLTLQVREVRPFEAWGVPYGYTVAINGRIVYVRDPAGPEAGSGPYRSVFLDTADPDLLRSGSAVVEITGTGGGSAYIAQLWAYRDLPGLVAQAGMRVPTRIVGVLGKDYQDDATLGGQAAYLVSTLHTSADVQLGASVLDYFPVRTPEQMAANYQRYLAISRDHDLPITVESTSDWEGTPGGVADGKGGTFGDIEYQQILWSPQDQTGPDKDVWKGKSLPDLLGEKYEPRYGLSVPNIWGNTPWLTWRHPDLNAYFTGKLNDSLDQIRPLLWELQKSGEAERILPFSTTMESTYWTAQDGIGVADGGYTDYNGGVPRKDILADFNPATVAAAAADGVVLDPHDLTDEAKHWLFKNQSYPQQMYADILYSGLPRERIVIRSGDAEYPRDMLRHNIFCEIYSRKQAPYWSGAFASIAQGVVRHARPGSEYIELDSYNTGGFEHLTRMREFGRLANPNLEDSVSGDPADKTLLLRQLYVNGSRYATLYNWRQGDVENYVNPFVDDLSPVDVDSTGPAVDSARGRQIAQDFVAGDLRLLDHVDVRVERAGSRPIELGVYEGSRILTMRHLSVAELLSRPGWVRFSVPVVETVAGRTYTVRITQDRPDATFGLVEGDQVTVDGTVRAGRRLALRTGLDMQGQRDRSLLVQWRRDAADAIAHVRADLTGNDREAAQLLATAATLLAGQRYVEAYRTAIRADALRYPVLFQVAAGPGGALAPFPVAVAGQSTVDVDVLVARDDQVRLALRAYAAGSVTVTVQGQFTRATLDGAALDIAGGAVTVQLPDTSVHTVQFTR